MIRRSTGWIALYLLLVAGPLLVLMAGPRPPGVEFWWDFSKGLGFAAITMFGIQFALTARFKRASAPFGIDIIYFVHRYLAWIALVLVLGHFVIIWLFFPEAAGPLDPREAAWEITAGRAALALFALAVISSQWRERFHLRYVLWRYSHVAFATAGFVAAVAHIVGVGYYTRVPATLALWLLLTLCWLGLAVWVRIVKPWQLKHRPYRVVGVRSEGSDSWTLALEPDGHPGIRRFHPGQFAWVTLRSSPYALREHPFSFSSAPEDLPRVEFTIKALGPFTRTVKEVEPGERAYVDGPYGVFSPVRWNDAPGLVFIAGGVGITPIMAMLRSLARRGEKRPLVLFDANPSLDDVLFREEIDSLTGKVDLHVVHVLEHPPEDWTGEKGFLDADILDRHLRKEGRAALAYFLCGPPAMTAAVERHLHALDVPESRIELEVFNLS